MRAYIIRRLFLMIPTMFLVTLIIFATIRFIPGDVIDLMVAEMTQESGMGSEMTPEYLRHAMGLDVPIHVQYGRWVGGAIQGDLGRSLWSNRSVTEDIFKRLPVTLELAVIGITVAILISLPIGMYSAVRQDTAGDYMGRTAGILAISLPPFWVGTIVVVYPAIFIGWSPPIEVIPFFEDPAGNLGQFALPAFIQGMAMTGGAMRMTRTMALEVLRQDYIRTAWAKGLRERTVVLRHAMKNAMIPVVSIIGLLIPVMLAGTVVIEEIFILPGIGNLLLDAIQKRDYPIISGINLILASSVLIMNLLVDLTYAFLDPRVQYR